MTDENERSDDIDTAPAPRPANDVHAERLVGQVLSGRYRVDSLLAMGGIGAVLAGEQLSLKKRVAIKVLHPRAENIKDHVARFEREALAGAHIEHPNVASAIDFGQLEDGTYYLVLELVTGSTLRDLIDQGPLAPLRAVKIARQIASALAAAHRMGVLHRDVKPSNVMLVAGEDDFVKLIDFGLAKIPPAWTGEHGIGELAKRPIITRKGEMFGTIAYMPPEAALGMDTVDERADLYALGVVLYKMLAGKHPFDAESAVEFLVQARTERPPPLAVRTPGVVVPPALEALVMKLLEKDVRARFASAEALVAALDAVLPAAASVPPPPATPAPPAPSWSGASELTSGAPVVMARGGDAEPAPAPRARSGSRTFEWIAVAAGIVLLAALAVAALR